MDTSDAIRQRRAVKHFDPDHRFTDDELAALMDLALQAPTSFNMQNWRFVLVRDLGAAEARLRAAAVDQAQVTDASMLFDPADRRPQGVGEGPGSATGATCAPGAGQPRCSWTGWEPFYEGKEQLPARRGHAQRAVIAGQTIMLAAKAMGYDSCPMIGFDAEKVAELIRLPEDHAVGMLLVVGKGTKPSWPKPGQLPSKRS